MASFGTEEKKEYAGPIFMIRIRAAVTLGVQIGVESRLWITIG